MDGWQERDREVIRMKTRIVVIGGYGHVGQAICRQLGERYPGLVYAAGRSAERAEAFTQSTGGQVLPMVFDLSQWKDESWLSTVRLVIMCMDQTDHAFVRACLRTGTHYVDISANGKFLNGLEAYGEEAAVHGATAVLSTGLAPGLTNLLARSAVEKLEETEKIEIAIMLGLGDSHGKAAIEWTIDNLKTNFDITEGGKKREAASFSGGKSMDMGFQWGKRTAYLFPFSDQQSLPRTLGVPGASTRLCFDSRVATALLASLHSTGLVRLINVNWVRNLLVRSFGWLKAGSDRYAVTVKGIGRDSTQTEFFLEGANESLATARTAAAVAQAVYSEALPGGVFHIDQLFELKAIDESIFLKTLESSTMVRYPIEGVRFASRL
jgi:saccharopine dehydrogenase (NAD+, L-lysine forming)